MALLFNGSAARSRSWLTTVRASGSSFMVEQEEFIFYAMHIYKILNSVEKVCKISSMLLRDITMLVK
jgi:hypothetical protein